MYNASMHYHLMHIVTANVRRCVDTLCDGNQSAAARRTGVPQPTIGRIMRGDVLPSLSVLEQIAKGFGLETWQLMVPGMEPKSPPVLSRASKEERDLYARLQDDLKKLANLSK